jgi:hypothetical protein
MQVFDMSMAPWLQRETRPAARYLPPAEAAHFPAGADPADLCGGEYGRP